jgi:hypothetical protein
VVEHGRVPVIKATALVKGEGGLVSYADLLKGKVRSVQALPPRLHQLTHTGQFESEDLVEIPLDISIDGPTHSGISSTSFVRVLTSRLPSLRPIVLCLKRLLAVHGLNDPFSGGLSSYALVLMVVFLMLKQRKLLFRSESNAERAEEGAGASPDASPTNPGKPNPGLSQSSSNVSGGGGSVRSRCYGLGG